MIVFKRLVLFLSVGLWVISSLCAEVPGILPRPDDTPPAADKPVKVYILAGQSNMVGFGKLRGSRPFYPSIYLSADPSCIPGKMPVGPSALLRHGVFQGVGKEAPAGALAEVFAGEYSSQVDYSSLKAVKQKTIALGTVSEDLPRIDGPHTVVVKACIEVPVSGTFEVYAGYQDSSHAIVVLNGEEVYRKEIGKPAVVTKTSLQGGTRYPLTITYLKGGSAAFFLKQVDLEGKGDLTSLTRKEGKFPWFIDDQGGWTTRNDVIYWNVRASKADIGSGGPLTVTSNAGGKFIGPEVPFGYVMGTYHEEPVLLIESSMGNRALSFDFRPPSSGRTDPDSKYEGLEYRLMVEGTRKALANIEKIVPDYQGQGYEMAGFVWFQGHKDNGISKEEYEKHLCNLIRDLREEFKAPDMKAVVATVAFDGPRMNAGYQAIHAAQMAVGDPEQHPEFKGNVASVDTRGYWRETSESPTGTGYHYNHNAETYVLTGDALGRAMVRMLGGEAEDIDLPPEPKRHPDVEKIYSYPVTSGKTGPDANPTPEQYKNMTDVLKPIILGHFIPEWVDASFHDPKFRFNGLSLRAILSERPPERVPSSIYSQFDALNDWYQAVGISDYHWKRLIPGMKSAEWSYFSFDPPEKQPLEKSGRMREITYPEGMENWNSVTFNPKAAGWRVGKAPFGQVNGKLMPRVRPKGECDYPVLCGCQGMPNTLWEKEVLLMTQTFEIPPIKDDHIYRIILGGAGCDRSGEGYAIYVNGKLLKKANGGYFRYDGIRGAYLHKEMLDEFRKGTVTISVLNFLRYTHFRNQTEWWNVFKEKAEPVPPNGQVSLWIEAARLPEVVIKAAKE